MIAFPECFDYVFCFCYLRFFRTEERQTFESIEIHQVH